MKGIAIYSDPMWGDNNNTVYCQPLMYANYRLHMSSARETVFSLAGEAPDNKELMKATCSPGAGCLEMMKDETLPTSGESGRET